MPRLASICLADLTLFKHPEAKRAEAALGAALGELPDLQSLQLPRLLSVRACRDEPRVHLLCCLHRCHRLQELRVHDCSDGDAFCAQMWRASRA